MDDLRCGDLVVRSRGNLGFDIYRKSYEEGERKVTWLNKAAEKALLQWLLLKNKTGEQ